MTVEIMIDIEDRAMVATAFAILRGQEPDMIVPLVLAAHYNHEMRATRKAGQDIVAGRKPTTETLARAGMEIRCDRLEFTLRAAERVGATSLSIEALASVNEMLVESILGRSR